MNSNIREALASGRLTSHSFKMKFVSSLRAEIPNFNQKYVDVEDLRLKWDLIKMEIRGFTIKYSKNTAKKRKSTKKNLQNQTNELYKKLKHHQITSKLSMKSMMPDRD